LHAERAYVVPLADAHAPISVLVLTAGASSDFGGEQGIWVRSFAEQAGTAIAQASVFAELGDKNEALARANRSIDERSQVIRDIVYALSHDLRTPLAAAAMTMQQALDGKYGPLSDAYREILRRSIEANSELRRLAETLLMIAKYESGEESTERSAVKLGSLARSVVEELDPLWRAKGIRLRVGDDESAVAAGDAGEIRRAAMNLIANAVSWTPEGGTIVVSVKREGDSAVLSVVDDGYGVPLAERSTLFQRLVSRQAPRAGSGSGLGLYIVRRIAENHGGSVMYKPVEPRGSEFTMTFPAFAAVEQHV
jgi:signal transduction histidine kinase